MACYFQKRVCLRYILLNAIVLTHAAKYCVNMSSRQATRVLAAVGVNIIPCIWFEKIIAGL